MNYDNKEVFFFKKIRPSVPAFLRYFLNLCSSDDVYAPFLAPCIIILNIVKVTLIGLGVVNSMTRHGDHR
jgi:hypothetical protein